MASRPPAFDTVSAESEYHGPGVPQLGLAGGAEARRTAAYRVYVLRCAPPRDNAPFRWYVGLAHKSQIAKRLRDQFQGGARAADFVRRARAIQVELVWPAETPAAEALVFYALLARLPATAVAAGRLGGWTQTQATRATSPHSCWSGTDGCWSVAASPAARAHTWPATVHDRSPTLANSRVGAARPQCT